MINDEIQKKAMDEMIKITNDPKMLEALMEFGKAITSTSLLAIQDIPAPLVVKYLISAMVGICFTTCSSRKMACDFISQELKRSIDTFPIMEQAFEAPQPEE